MKNKLNPFLLLLMAASLSLTISTAACNKTQPPDNTAQNPAQPADQSQPDPAAAANPWLRPATPQLPRRLLPPHPLPLPLLLLRGVTASPVIPARKIPATTPTPIITTTIIRIPITASRICMPRSLRRSCRNIRNRSAPAMDTCGRPATGASARKAITGFPARGRIRRRPATCGLPAIGDMLAADTAITTDIGDATSATTAASIMVLDTSAWATRADIGTAIVSTTTAPSIT